MNPLIERQLRELWPRLFGYALVLAGKPDVAQDLLQECALKALSSRSRPSRERTVRAWLFKIMRNAWIDRRRCHHPSEQIDTSCEPIGCDAWRHDDRVIAAITVRQALAQIHPTHREVIELVDIAGFRYAETAEILGVPVGTVMSRLSRARLALIEAIGRGNVETCAAVRRRARRCGGRRASDRPASHDAAIA